MIHHIRRWYTSDLHFGHQNIIKYCNRPFADVTEMNETIVKRWNSVVHPDDTVFIVGDLALGKLVDSLELASTLSGNKFLVPGNHDRCWFGHSKVRPKDSEVYRDAGFKILTSQVRNCIELEDGRVVSVLVCHFPYSGDSQDNDRHVNHRPADRGEWLIHGHTHSSKKVRGRQIHVGMDAWNYWPVQESAIAEIIRRGD